MAGEVIVANYRGLVFSMDKKSAVVATPENAVYKISRTRTMYIGKEVIFSDKDIIDQSYYIKRYLAAAACFCLIMGIAVAFLLNYNKSFSIFREYAYISLDINPSVEFTIDKTQKVLKVDPLNNDADELLKEEKLKGMKIKEAINRLYKIYRDNDIIDKDNVYVLISGTLNSDYEDDKKEDIENILDELTESIQIQSDFEANIVALEISPEIRDKALEHGVSPSKYAIFSVIKKNGGEISIEKIKSSSTHELVEIYNDMNKSTDTSNEPVYTPEPTFDVGEVESPTPDLTPTPIAEESPTPVATETPTPTVVKTPTPIKTEGFVYAPTPTVHVPTMTPYMPTPTKEPVPTPMPKPTPVPTPTVKKVEPGTGLRGEYFDNIDLTNFKLTRVDSKIDFYWGINSPAKEIRDDESYSVRWSGKIRPDHTGEYTFHITRDNGVKLWVNNKLIVDKWDNLVGKDETGKIFLEADKFYDIKLEYFNNSGDGYVKLEWSGVNVPKAVVPAKNLYPADPKELPPPLPGDGMGLYYEYFDEDNLTNLKEQGVDSNIYFNWGVGAPSKAIQADHKFSIRWKGFIQAPYDGDYVFYVTYDDGANLWVDGQLLIDKWNVSEINTVKSAPIHLKAGQKVPIRLIYHNNNLAGMVKLEWESTDIKRSVVPQSCLHPW